LKRFWFFVTPFLLFGEYGIFFYLFLRAYFALGKRFVAINLFGEANLELIVYTTLFLIGLIWLSYWIKWGVRHGALEKNVPIP
jgi:hypothetical protein